MEIAIAIIFIVVLTILLKVFSKNPDPKDVRTGESLPINIAKPQKKEDYSNNLATKSRRMSLSYMNRFIKGASADDATFNLMEMAILNGQDFIYISQRALDACEAKLQLHNLKETEFSRLREMKHTAQGLEKAGDLHGAYAAFKALIIYASRSTTLTSKNYSHDINRFRIVCNKLKRKGEYESFMAGIVVRSDGTVRY